MEQIKRNNENEQYIGPPSMRRTESFPSSRTESMSSGSNYRKRTSHDYKVPIEKFNGVELYPGLGGNFREWGENFIMELVTLQESM